MTDHHTESPLSEEIRKLLSELPDDERDQTSLAERSPKRVAFNKTMWKSNHFWDAGKNGTEIH